MADYEHDTGPVKVLLLAAGLATFDALGAAESEYDILRRAMVEEITAQHHGLPGGFDPRVTDAMARVPRHLFVPPAKQPFAYENRPLTIGHGQTISQPYIVALMAEAAEIAPDNRVLEVGTGSGYAAAVTAGEGANAASTNATQVRSARPSECREPPEFSAIGV